MSVSYKMVNEDDKPLPVRKPVPLPRKSLYKQNKVVPFKEEESEKKGFCREDWKSASGSFVFEKGRQVQKSVKNIISRRRSLHNKSPRDVPDTPRCDSLPDSVFLNISFNSPLTDDEKQNDSQSLDISFYETELEPPPYPPPPPPDESLYDIMRTCSLSDQQSTDSSSTYDEPIHSSQLSDDDRYESIENCSSESRTLPDIPESDILSLKSETNEASHIKYIIHLFDPLNSSSFGVESKSQIPNSTLMQNLDEGNYGRIQKIKRVENEYVGLNTIKEQHPESEPPPIPPRKFDSVVNEPIKVVSEKYENIPVEEKPKDILQWSSLKRVAKKVAVNLESRASYISLSGKKGKGEEMEKSCESCLLPQSYPKHSGVLIKAGGVQRWGVLSQRKLTLFANKDSPDVKETIPMDGVLSVETTHNKIGNESVGVYCFEVSIPSRNQPSLFGVPSVSERHIWMRKLLESIGHLFPAKLSMDYTKAGWCYAKESVTCAWVKNYILLHHRTLYMAPENGSFTTADLRKARKIILQTDGFICEEVTEKGPLLLIDLQDRTLYLQMDYERETKAWEETLIAAALKNGPMLCEQQLTKDDVPAIVDKCLNFIHTHGTFSEGIYRRNGSNRTVNQLLASFRCNAWGIQLSKEECSEFDVSSVLKRYFRDLPEPLLVPEIHEELGTIIDISDEKEKLEKYKLTLKKLPDINYLTAKRLMGHLYFVNKQKDINLMGADNLAAVWGPTLMQVQEEVSLDSNCFKVESLVINDLISFYPEIFEVSESEIQKEMKILEMLESYHKNSNTLTKKPSGELKIWVYLHSANNVDNCVNISINPHKTAEEVCKELSYKTNDPVHLLCLEEVVCNGQLTRPLNHSEKVLETVLRWSYWDEADRKNNCLVLTKNNLFREVVSSAKHPVIICEELKFADQKSKSFKTYQFEFSQAKLICFKDKMKIAEWKVEDIVWYFGHEPKRVPQMRWSITFIEKQFIGPRTKDRPFFGNTLAGTSEEQKFKLISAMLMAQYAKDILPTPNLME